jgi:hypothetical protein
MELVSLRDLNYASVKNAISTGYQSFLTNLSLVVFLSETI